MTGSFNWNLTRKAGFEYHASPAFNFTQFTFQPVDVAGIPGQANYSRSMDTLYQAKEMAPPLIRPMTKNTPLIVSEASRAINPIAGGNYFSDLMVTKATGLNPTNYSLLGNDDIRDRLLAHNVAASNPLSPEYALAIAGDGFVKPNIPFDLDPRFNDGQNKLYVVGRAMSGDPEAIRTLRQLNQPMESKFNDFQEFLQGFMGSILGGSIGLQDEQGRVFVNKSKKKKTKKKKRPATDPFGGGGGGDDGDDDEGGGGGGGGGFGTGDGGGMPPPRYYRREGGGGDNPFNGGDDNPFSPPTPSSMSTLGADYMAKVSPTENPHVVNDNDDTHGSIDNFGLTLSRIRDIFSDSLNGKLSAVTNGGKFDNNPLNMLSINKDNIQKGMTSLGLMFGRGAPPAYSKDAVLHQEIGEDTPFSIAKNVGIDKLGVKMSVAGVYFAYFIADMFTKAFQAGLEFTKRRNILDRDTNYATPLNMDQQPETKRYKGVTDLTQDDIIGKSATGDAEGDISVSSETPIYAVSGMMDPSFGIRLGTTPGAQFVTGRSAINQLSGVSGDALRVNSTRLSSSKAQESDYEKDEHKVFEFFIDPGLQAQQTAAYQQLRDAQPDLVGDSAVVAVQPKSKTNNRLVSPTYTITTYKPSKKPLHELYDAPSRPTQSISKYPRIEKVPIQNISTPYQYKTIDRKDERIINRRRKISEINNQDAENRRGLIENNPPMLQPKDESPSGMNLVPIKSHTAQIVDAVKVGSMFEYSKMPNYDDLFNTARLKATDIVLYDKQYKHHTDLNYGKPGSYLAESSAVGFLVLTNFMRAIGIADSQVFQLYEAHRDKSTFSRFVSSPHISANNQTMLGNQIRNIKAGLSDDVSIINTDAGINEQIEILSNMEELAAQFAAKSKKPIENPLLVNLRKYLAKVNTTIALLRLKSTMQNNSVLRAGGMMNQSIDYLNTTLSRNIVELKKQF